MRTYRTYFVIFFLVAIFAGLSFKQNRVNTDTIKFWAEEPISPDPIEYDLMVNSQIFSSTFSTLLTQHKKGEYVGILAKGWSASNNKMVWSFEIRENIYFENGDAITPTAILRSFTRLAYLMSKRNSHEGLLSNLAGYDKIRSPTDTIDGLSADGTKFRMVFIKPMPKVLELISFGLYSVVHSNDFDKKTGNWKDKKRFVSSGSYSLSSWEKSDLTLKLRETFLPALGHKNKFKNVYMSWDKTQDRNSFDIFWGPEFDEPNGRLFNFNNGARNYILYLKCYSWKIKKSPLFELEVRRRLRAAFYSIVTKGFEITSSFFPMAISGITPPQKNFDMQQPLNDILKTKLKINYPRLGSNLFKKIYSSTWQTISKANSELVEQVHIDPPKLFEVTDPDREEYPVDLGVHYTDIFLESPDEDIRFMFLSKEGIQLPDVSGQIIPILKQSSFDFQTVNELIWDQAVVWPVTHFSIGVWSKPEIDVSMLNFLKAHIDFFWVGSN